jgi:hypothetical protein
LIGDSLREIFMFGRVDLRQAASQDGDGSTAVLEGFSVTDPIDTTSKTADDGAAV